MVVRCWRALAAFGGMTACALAVSIPRAGAQSLLMENAPAPAAGVDPNSAAGTDADYQQLLQRLQSDKARIEELEGQAGARSGQRAWIRDCAAQNGDECLPEVLRKDVLSALPSMATLRIGGSMILRQPSERQTQSSD